MASALVDAGRICKTLGPGGPVWHGISHRLQRGETATPISASGSDRSTSIRR